MNIFSDYSNILTVIGFNRGRGRMIVEFRNTNAISAYHH